LLLEDREWVPLPEAVDGWDPGTNLRITQRVQLNVERFFHETALGLRDVAVVASWTSSTTAMTEAATPVPFDPTGAAVVDTVLVGNRISGVLTVRSRVSLIHAREGRSVGVASIPGSILAEHTQRVVLEDVSSMFPVHEIDFSHTRLSPMASWYLENSTDLTAPFYGTFRLLINKRDRELSAAVSRGAKDRRQQGLLDELQAEVAALLLELALYLRSELAERDEWPVDSVGDVLARVVASSPVMPVAPPSAAELADFRTQIGGVVRYRGKGRIFR
jgi:hypothetical protein